MLNTDVYSRITNKIIADLEKGNLTWRQPWSSEYLTRNVERPLRWNAVPYAGINTIMLWATAAENGFQSPYWMTYKQALDLKAHVRKGECAAQVVFADKIEKEEKTLKGDVATREIPFLKLYSVFNANQIDGLPETFYEVPKIEEENTEQRRDDIDAFFRQTRAEIVTGVKAAYYLHSDHIEMPPFGSFVNAATYYSTLSHEMTHWTRHPTRLNRDFNRKKWGDEGYAKEELVAELGACFLAADLGLEPVTKEEHAAYIQSWLGVLKNDNRFIFHAASHAQKAVELLARLQPTAGGMDEIPALVRNLKRITPTIIA